MVVVAFCLAPSSTPYFFVLSFCHIFWVCGLFCRLQDPSSSCSVVFPQGVRLVHRLVPLSPWSGLWLLLFCPEPPLDIQGSFPLALWLSLPCQGWGLLPGWWRRAPRSVSLLWFWSVVKAGSIWGHLGEKPLRIAPLGLFTLGCAHALCESHVTPCWHCSWPPFNHGHAGTLLWCLSDVVFTGTPAQIQWTKVPELYSGAGPAVALWGQLRLWPGPTP